MTSGEEHARSATSASAITARLDQFNLHKEALLAFLQRECERQSKTEPFNRNGAWRHLKFMAQVYLQEEANIERNRMLPPAMGRIKQLQRLKTDLLKARCSLNQVMKDDLRGRVFLAWCETHGDPDLTDPVMDLFDSKFDDHMKDLRAGLADLARVASNAAAQCHQKPGRPAGTSILQDDFIVRLESTYRDITGKIGGAGPGPFAKFVKRFLEALGRESTEQTVIEAIKGAKRREEKNPATSRWGRSWLAGLGSEIPRPKRN
jgi:hypothetical protein